MTKQLKVGIAGYGVVGKRRRHWIDQHPNLKTISVCDQNFHFEGKMDDGVLYFSTYHGLLKSDIDVLFVSLPNYLAPEVTIAGLKSGMHVFCEKPPGRNVEDIIRVIEEERLHPSLFLKYGFNHRYHDSVKDALRIIESKKMGEIINLRGVYGKSKIIPFGGGWRSERNQAGGGILLDQGIHLVDLMILFCGDFIDVKSYISNSYWNHDVEDNAYAIMRSQSGKIAMLHSSATQWQHRFYLDIAMTDGSILLDGILSGSKSYGEEKLTICRRSESDAGTLKNETTTYLEDNSWKEEIFEFADAICNNSKIKHGSSLDALKSMSLVQKIYCSDNEWKQKYYQEK